MCVSVSVYTDSSVKMARCVISREAVSWERRRWRRVEPPHDTSSAGEECLQAMEGVVPACVE